MTSKFYWRGAGIGLIICLCAFSEGCHKDAITPTALINIKLGYFGLIGGSGNAWQIMPFPNQKTITEDDLITHTQNSLEKGMIIILNESNVNCNVVPENLDSLEFVFNLTTNHDHEIFDTGRNGLEAEYGEGRGTYTYSCGVMAQYRIPIKFTGNATSNNDTLEINSTDTVKYSYLSRYTAKSYSSKLVVMQ